MSAENEGAHSSSDRNAPPFRAGALSPEKIRGECPQFRILIIGKANAGKTTILRKVCNAKPDAKPVIYDAEGKEVKRDKRDLADFFRLGKMFGHMKKHSTDVQNPSTDVLNPSTERGEHNIEYQLTYPGSGFIFHDSRGIESGSKAELEIVNEFIKYREQAVELKDQLHVIWYCVPMDDQRPISGAEQAFFSLGTGRVPVVLIFTKFDALELKCYSELLEQGKSYEEASIQAPGLANDTFQNKYLPRVQGAKFPPKTYVCLSGLDKEDNQCSELSEKTMNILDDDILINLFVSTQQNNLDLCIKRSIKNVWKTGALSQMLLVYGIIVIFPNFWNSQGYKPNEKERLNLERLRARLRRAEELERLNLELVERLNLEARRAAEEVKIWKVLYQQFPSLFSQDERKNIHHGLSKFQAIAVIVLLAEHSFWFSGKDIEEQFHHAIKSFKSQKHITIDIVKAGVEAAFNNASDQSDPAWLIQWVIAHKLNHK